MIALHCRNMRPLAEFLVMLQVGLSLLLRSKGNLNAECAVRPPDNRVDAIPDEATATIMSDLDLTCASIRFMRNVLPVPPGASIKKSPPELLSIALMIVSKTNP